MQNLSKQLPIALVEISLFSHATENEEKVLQAARHLLPPDKVDEVVFKRTNLKGHHGNPIVLFESKIKDKAIIKAIAEYLASNLRPLDKETLSNEISMHVEKGSFFIRLDKQAAFENSLKLTTADPIRIRLRFKKNRLEDVLQVCREIGMLPR